ncbi:5'-methylthioadenosine/S-adenosylhomocysteine nucleosidase [Paenibacillus terrigena]|uniref:5'-methylthioadenosine/S-adenosylhomocysteine nucleosidase n=1 Tax=Paenibacillus terrigena TaxID=369333 RepID=UPI0028D4EC74|nr:5'-methylthioadenosine/S-adenosylhomocysteine nucleosidase [Paenibacillus terrigena]
MKKIGIIAAWEPELQYLLKQYKPIKTETVAARTFYTHQLANLHIISVVAGVGKVKTASCTQLLITNYFPDELYMTGICGGLSEEVSGGDIIIAEKTIQHDVTDAGISNDPLDAYLGRSSIIDSTQEIISMFKEFTRNTAERVHFGTFVSGDQRIRDNELSYKLMTDFAAIAVDQELAAFAHVCYLNNINFMGLKSVSDKANTNTINDQKLFIQKACINSCKLLIDFLDYRQRR